MFGPTIKTNRLILRPIGLSDVDAVHAYASNPTVTRYMLWGPNTYKETREFVRRVRDNGRAEPRRAYDFAITLTESEQLIGACGLYGRDTIHRSAELGYVLAPQYWGLGYMTEAASGILDYGFGALRLHRIFAHCHPDNSASANVLKKLGMTYEGRLREARCIKGEWWDFSVYGVLDREHRTRL